MVIFKCLLLAIQNWKLPLTQTILLREVGVNVKHYNFDDVRFSFGHIPNFLLTSHFTQKKNISNNSLT